MEKIDALTELVRHARINESAPRIVVRRIEAGEERRELIRGGRIAVEQVLHAERQLPVPKAGVRALQVPEAERANRARIAFEIAILIGVRRLVRLRERRRPWAQIPRER